MQRPFAPDSWHVSLAALGLMCVLPFLQPVHGYPLTSFYSEWLAFALGIAALAPLAGKRVWQDMTVPAIALAPLALIALLMVQLVADRVLYTGQALTAAIYLVWTALLITLGHHLRQALGLTTVSVALAWFVLAGGLLSTLVAWLQHYQISTVLDAVIARKNSNAVFGNLGQPNHFADYVTLALGSLTFLFARSSLSRAAAAACAMPMLLVLALSGSRSIWLYLVMLLGLAFWFYRRRQEPAGRRLLSCTLLLTAGFVLAQALVMLPLFAPDQGLATTAAQRLFESSPGPSARLELWREAWGMFTRFPLLGAGWGQFSWRHFEYQALASGAAPLGLFNHAHNIVLHLLAETGVAGALLVAGGALWWLRGVPRATLAFEYWWLLALLGVIGLHSMLELPLWSAYFLGIAALLLGLGATRLVTLGLRRIGRLAALLVIMAGAFNALSLGYGYRDFERLFTKESDALGDPQLVTLLSRAQADPVLEPYAELAASFGIKVSREKLKEKLELNNRVMHFAPIEDVVYRQALLLALNGEPAAARRQFGLAARVYPAAIPSVTAGLRELAVKYPEEFTPLLELATATAAEARDPPAAR